MLKLIGLGLLATAMAAPLHAAAEDTVDWVDWTNFAGSVSQNGKTIGVTFTGTALDNTHADWFTGHEGAYITPEVSNAPGTEGILTFVGGDATLHHIHFSEAVKNPYLAIVSLGAANYTSSFNFQNVDSITLISEGAGYFGDGKIEIAGGTVSGEEGHGVVRLNGTFTDLYFTTPVNEYWYGATLGVQVSAVPEPGSWCMLLAGGAMLGMLGRRRRHGTLAQRA